MSYQRQIEREQKAAYIESRQNEVDKRNKALEAALTSLQSILEVGLNRQITFQSVVASCNNPAIIPTLPPAPEPPPDREKFEAQKPKAKWLEKVAGIGKKKRLEQVEYIERKYQMLVEDYNRKRQAYERQLQLRNQAINDLREKIAAKDPKAVTTYFRMIIDQSFPNNAHKFSYTPETAELIIEFELPSYDSIIPKTKGYKYVKSRDQIEELKFTQSDERKMKALYEEVIAAITLRTIHEVMKGSTPDLLNSVIFNGMLTGVDKATGKSVRPCLVSVQASREEFSQLDLRKVDKRACLKYLKAQTSPSPTELIAIKPVVRLVTTDERFIPEVDVLSKIDSRTNLLEMDPFEFEHLISNLFEKIGLKTSTTRASRDGGVDVVAFDERPIFGGKVIIQAKRYRNTVEVSAVRDLYGSMLNEGASKGILVTTSTFGAESRNFAKDKPIELIDGNGLLYLLEQHGYNVKIEIPKQA